MKVLKSGVIEGLLEYDSVDVSHSKHLCCHFGLTYLLLIVVFLLHVSLPMHAHRDIVLPILTVCPMSILLPTLMDISSRFFDVLIGASVPITLDFRPLLYKIPRETTSVWH